MVCVYVYVCMCMYVYVCVCMYGVSLPGPERCHRASAGSQGPELCEGTCMSRSWVAKLEHVRPRGRRLVRVLGVRRAILDVARVIDRVLALTWVGVPGRARHAAEQVLGSDAVVGVGVGLMPATHARVILRVNIESPFSWLRAIGLPHIPMAQMHA